jgi:23S rRNA (adenine2503-C2)-methyltransferase
MNSKPEYYFCMMAKAREKRDIRSLSLQELEKTIEALGEKPFRARQLYRWLWNKSTVSFDQMTDLSKPFRTKLEDNFTLRPLRIAESQSSRDGTLKFAFSSFDNHLVEGVLIPSGQRTTACLSAQIGCSLNCSFCATGRMNYIRNLTAGEITDQLRYIARAAEDSTGRKLSNIVMMGMGEPLLNYDNTVLALDRISDPEGYGFSPRRITLSTAGIASMIRKLADDLLPCLLAVSLHTASDTKRNLIMPVNKSNPLSALSSAISYYYDKTGNRITYEYLMLKDFNDSLPDAESLAGFCRISPCKINLIEYNQVPESPFEGSDTYRINKFRQYLEGKNLIINIRRSKGVDIAAACGQLAGRMPPDHGSRL